MASSNVPRRGVLAGGLAAAVTLTAGLTGCRDSPKAQPPSPILPVRADSLALLAAYDATLRRHPDLTDRLKPLREDHRRHVQELDHELGSAAPSASGSASASPSASAVPATADAALGSLTGQEKQAEQHARQSCLTAPDRYATVFASIAACRASHVEALR
ncbi:lipoprotein [Actinocatenispora thailandica]|uniref:Lipoprotein n=1 Tax=Actinocatenispora thailandica TaxID=227318 RepID=A0A7R7HW97_9ACTN|nr:hypothetical protein [Actinocatenispora thailandica]BCJ34852.1 lipoprotein [Actinocatenispora thailandica]